LPVSHFIIQTSAGRVKTILGGAPVNEQAREFTGADYYPVDAVAGVSICKQIYVEKEVIRSDLGPL